MLVKNPLRLSATHLFPLAMLCLLMASTAWANPEVLPTVVEEPAAEVAEVCTDQVEPEFMAAAFPVQPKPRGLRCEYTCEGGSEDWILICSKSTEEECCEIANAACPGVEPGTTGTSSCSC